MSIVSHSYNNILKDLPEKMERYSILDEVGAIINSNYYGTADSKNMNAAIAQGYVSGLADSYSKFMTADEYEAYQSETQGNMAGIGIEYSKNGDGYINIDKVYSGSPAQTAGIEAGDVIVAFDGEAITGENYDDMESKLVGDKLTTVNMTYRREGVESTVSVVKGYEATSVTSSTKETVGYISISNFYSTTAKQVEDAIDRFVKAEVDGIVLDVRGNSSTNFNEAVKILDIFIPIVEGSGGVATLVNADGEVIKTYTSTSGAVNIKTVVLIDGKTSGGAELLACDLRDFGKAELVGEKTNGMGLAQDVFPLSDGSALKLTIGQVVPYMSETFHKTGVSPDHEVKNEKAPGSIDDDAVYMYAAALMTDDSTQQ